MKRSVTRDLYAYWNTLREGRGAPHFDGIDPGAIRGLLADVFVLSFDPAGGHPFRLAGTAVCALFGRELKGASFATLWRAGQRARLRQTLQTMAEDGAGFVAGASGDTAEGDLLDLEMLLLPLAGDDGSPGRVIGALGLQALPFWLGFRPLRALSLTSLRFVRPGEKQIPSLPDPEAPLRGRGFVLYPARFSSIPRNYQG